MKPSSNTNKNRVRNSRLAAVIAVAAFAVSRGTLPFGSWPYEISIYLGYFCIILCVLGRIYATAYIGGFKNKVLITQGPFSVTRNPLYLFSFIGILGVGLASARLSVLVFLLGLHIVSYYFLIRREEAWLETTFGKEYRDYRVRVPRLVPNLALMQSPESIQLRPRLLYCAIRDGSAWFLVFPLFRLIDHLHAHGSLPTLFLLP